jgi:hypothetical protein
VEGENEIAFTKIIHLVAFELWSIPTVLALALIAAFLPGACAGNLASGSAA